MVVSFIIEEWKTNVNDRNGKEKYIFDYIEIEIFYTV